MIEKEVQEHVCKEVLKNIVDNGQNYSERAKFNLKKIIDCGRSPEDICEGILAYLATYGCQWTKNAHGSLISKKFFRNGIIEGCSLNIETSDFIGIFGKEKRSADTLLLSLRYKSIWFYRDIEEVYIGKCIAKKDKVNIAENSERSTVLSSAVKRKCVRLHIHMEQVIFKKYWTNCWRESKQ